jgi:hypothetical protein
MPDSTDLEEVYGRWRLRRGGRRQIWRRENEYGYSGLDQLAPVDVRLLDRFDALICRVFHRDRWLDGIDAYHGNGISMDFTCAFCGRSWYTYDFEHPERYRARRQQEALERTATSPPKPESRVPSPSPWSALTEPEALAVMDLIREFRQPDRHGVSTEHFACILQSGPGPDAQPVERADLIGRLRRDLERAKDRGLDPEKVYRAALQVQPTLAANPLLPQPLPSFEEVAPS